MPDARQTLAGALAFAASALAVAPFPALAEDPPKLCVLHGDDPAKPALFEAAAGAGRVEIPEPVRDQVRGVEFTARGCLAMLKPVDPDDNPVSASGYGLVVMLPQQVKPFASVSCTCF